MEGGKKEKNLEINSFVFIFFTTFPFENFTNYKKSSISLIFSVCSFDIIIWFLLDNNN